MFAGGAKIIVTPLIALTTADDVAINFPQSVVGIIIAVLQYCLTMCFSDLWPIRPNRQLGLYADIHERKIQGCAHTQ